MGTDVESTVNLDKGMSDECALCFNLCPLLNLEYLIEIALVISFIFLSHSHMWPL